MAEHGRPGRRLGDIALTAWAGAALLFLFTPIAIIVLFSFNEPGTTGPDGEFIPSRSNYSWGRFSTDAWRDPFEIPELRDAFWLSVRVALIATLIALVLGVAMSMALVKYRFTGKGLVNTLLVLPLTMPEIVLGFSLLTLFVYADRPRGVLTIIIAHVMFCVSYVASTVKARIRGFDWNLEEAANDLGAGPWRTFTKVTFPIIAPGVFAAGLLTFALSLDDFIITYFNSGREQTFPVWVWNQKRSSVPTQINVFGTMVLIAAVILAVGGLLVQRRRERLPAN